MPRKNSDKKLRRRLLPFPRILTIRKERRHRPREKLPDSKSAGLSMSRPPPHLPTDSTKRKMSRLLFMISEEELLICLFWKYRPIRLKLKQPEETRTWEEMILTSALSNGLWMNF